MLDARIGPVAARSHHRIPRDAVTGWLFAAPIILYFTIFVFAPIIGAMAFVVFNWNGVAPLATARFIGLQNIEQLVSDSQYLGAYQNTFAYAITVVATGTFLGLALALALNSVNRFVGLVRSIYFLPVILPLTAMSLLWVLLYQPAYGMFNQVLAYVGLPIGTWLDEPNTALFSICLMVIWKSAGWYMVIFIAGLKAIPDHFYEAAKIDGAGPWQRFLNITVPMLKPTILFVLVIGAIGGLQVFAPVYIMTQGGPANATNVVVYTMYLTAFRFYEFSYATTMAAGLFVVILVITMIQMRLFREGGLTSYYD